MKNWTRPEVSELEVSLTANGCKDCYCEFFIWNDDKNEIPNTNPDDDKDKTQAS